MSGRKRMVCLANSRKLAGRSLAGRELVDRRTGGWLRPVSARPGREVSEYERQYEDGSDPRVLDVVSVPVLEPCAEGWQTENWLLDPEHYWRKEGTWAWFDLPALADPAAPLWIDGCHTHQGRNDRLPAQPAAQEPISGTVAVSIDAGKVPVRSNERVDDVGKKKYEREYRDVKVATVGRYSGMPSTRRRSAAR